MKIFSRFFVCVSLAYCLFSCQKKKEQTEEKYEGPLSSVDSSRTIVSDSSIMIAKIEAIREDRFENNDREWPQGIVLKSYNKNSRKPVCILSCKHAFYTKETNLYKASDSVVVRNFENGDKLMTEELFWNPKEHIFYTDKYVKIETSEETHTGDGLKAADDFSYFRIIHPEGTLSVDEFSAGSDSTSNKPNQ